MKKLLFILVLTILIGCSDSDNVFSQMDKSQQVTNFFTFLTQLDLPKKMDLFGERIPLEVPEVRERFEREFYLLMQQPGQVILYMKRAGRFFPMFEKIAKENDVPDDVKYLAVAESALYMSRSTKGAIGLWQFMAETGRLMGLQVDDYVDERRDPEKSTVAAMKYLKNGYHKHKSWIMSAAGYNMGHGSVAECKEYQKAKDFFDLFLNEETSRYVLRIAAIKEIMSNPGKYGFKLRKDQLYSPDNVKSIKVDEGISNLSEWAIKHNTTYKDVKILNPWILGKRLPSPRGKAYEIAVPA